jgi:hypothetical protein
MRMRKKFVSLLATFGLIVAGLVVTASPAQAAACTPNACYVYTGFRQTVDFDGIGFLLSKETPAVDTKTWHSLAELSVHDASGNNTVEIGWTRDPLVCAAGVTVCVFMGNWVAGTFGCYNGCGAVNAAGCSPYCLGASLDGIANGTSKNFALQHICTPTCSWWGGVDGVWRFSIPDSDWGVNAFTVGKKWQIFGEIAEKDTTTCADMMNGVLPTGSPTFLGGKANSMTMVNPSAALAPTTFSSDVTKWNALMVTGTSGRFGGPGNC